MANVFQVDDRVIHQVLENGLGLLSQKVNFIPTLHMGFKGEFARRNRPIGKTVKVENPMRWEVKSGAQLDTQEITDSVTEVTVNQHSQISFPLTIDELTFNVTEFTEKYIGTAMRDMASIIEQKSIAKLYKYVANQIGGVGSTDTFDYDMLVDAETCLANGLAPEENKCAIVNPVAFGNFKKSVKEYFNPSEQIAKYFRSAEMEGVVSGFRKVIRNTFMPKHTTGAYTGAPPILVNGGDQKGLSINVDGGSAAKGLNEGDIITFGGGVNAVHAQSKTDMGYAKQFVVTEDWDHGDTSIKIYPAIVETGPEQNVTSVPIDNANVYPRLIQGVNTLATPSKAYNVGLAYHKDFATFVSIPFQEPPKSDRFGSAVYWQQKELDGINMALCIDWDNQNYRTVMRLDVAWDVSILRPEIACRIASA